MKKALAAKPKKVKKPKAKVAAPAAKAAATKAPVAKAPAAAAKPPAKKWADCYLINFEKYTKPFYFPFFISYYSYLRNPLLVHW